MLDNRGLDKYFLRKLNGLRPGISRKAAAWESISTQLDKQNHPWKKMVMTGAGFLAIASLFIIEFSVQRDQSQINQKLNNTTSDISGIYGAKDIGRINSNPQPLSEKTQNFKSYFPKQGKKDLLPIHIGMDLKKEGISKLPTELSQVSNSIDKVLFKSLTRNKSRNSIVDNSDLVTTHFWDNPGKVSNGISVEAYNRSGGLNYPVGTFKNEAGIQAELLWNANIGMFYTRELNSNTRLQSTGISFGIPVLKIAKGTVSAGVSMVWRSISNIHPELTAIDVEPVVGLIANLDDGQMTKNRSAIGFDAGIWYAGSKFFGGLSLKNFNKPVYGFISDGQRVHSELRIEAGMHQQLNGINFMPVINHTYSDGKNRLSGMLYAGVCEKLTVGAGLTDFFPGKKGNIRLDGLLNMGKRTQGLLGYSYQSNSSKVFSDKHYIYSGIKLQIQ